MIETEIVRAVFFGGQAYELRPDDSPMPFVGKTDHALMAAMTDGEIEAEAANDQEAPPISDTKWTIEVLQAPLKVPVSLRLDDNIVYRFDVQWRKHQT